MSQIILANYDDHLPCHMEITSINFLVVSWVDVASTGVESPRGISPPGEFRPQGLTEPDVNLSTPCVIGLEPFPEKSWVWCAVPFTPVGIWSLVEQEMIEVDTPVLVSKHDAQDIVGDATEQRRPAEHRDVLVCGDGAPNSEIEHVACQDAD